MNTNKLYRDEQHKMIGGVCAGLAEYFAVDVSIVRILFLLAFFMKGSGVLLYIILWIVLPPKEIIWKQPGVDYTTVPNDAAGPDPLIMPEFQKTPRRRSNAAVIAGVVLIVLGGLLLIDEYGLIPDFDFGHLWPVIIIVLGLAIIGTSLKGKSSNTKPPVI